MTIATLFARIGMKDEATAKLATFEKQVKNVGDTFKYLIGSAVAFGAAVVGTLKYSMGLAVGFKQFAAETGASAEELQRWQAVAGQTNVSADALMDSVKELASNREKIKLGQGNIKAFQLLGIDPMQDPFKILEDLKVKTAGLPQAMKRNLLQEMGVSSQLLQILELSNDQFAEMKANAFVIPQSSIDALARTNASITLAGNAIKWISSLIAERLAPVVERVTRAFVAWIKANKEGLIAGIATAFKILMSFVGALFTVGKMISDVITHTIGWRNAILVVAAAWAIMNRALLLSPIGLIIAGIVLLIAVLDDLYRYSHGQKSAFGAFANSSKPFKEFLDGFLEVVRGLSAAMSSIFSGDRSGLDSLIAKWGVWGRLVASVADGVTAIANTLGGIGDLVSGKGLGTFGANMNKFGEDMAHDLGLLDKSEEAKYQAERNGAQAPVVNLKVTQTGDTQDRLKIEAEKDKVFESTRRAYANRVNH